MLVAWWCRLATFPQEFLQLLVSSQCIGVVLGIPLWSLCGLGVATMRQYMQPTGLYQYHCIMPHSLNICKPYELLLEPILTFMLLLVPSTRLVLFRVRQKPNERGEPLNNSENDYCPQELLTSRYITSNKDNINAVNGQPVSKKHQSKKELHYIIVSSQVYIYTTCLQFQY